MKVNTNSTNLITLRKTNSDCANYTGTVTVATYFGDTLVEKEVHHNAGLANLFKFIGNCLQGSWRDAQNTRPCKLVLLRADNDEKFFIDAANEETVFEDGELQDNSSEEAGNEESESESEGAGESETEKNIIYSTPLTKPEYWKSDYAVCNPIMYDTPPIADFSNAEPNSSSPSSSVTYHFRIPFLSLISGAEIKKLMLLPSTASDYAKEACAYFILKNPLNIPSASSNFTVIIDWTLTFMNAAATGENNE